MSSGALDILLSGENSEDIVNRLREFIDECYQKVVNNQYPLSEFIITKQLTRPPEKYKDAKSQPHVQVALRLKKQGEQNIDGQYIPFVICQEEATSYAERARHPEDVLSSAGALKIDISWYISQQILPPLHRLCSQIATITPGEIATWMGLEAKTYDIVQNDTSNPYVHTKGAEKLSLTCETCHTKYETDDNSYLCKNESCKTTPSMSQIENSVTRMLREKMISHYTQGRKCVESTCGKTSFKIDKRCKCKADMVHKYSLIQLHEQIYYLIDVFSKKPKMDVIATIRDMLKKKLEDMLKKSGYQKIQLKQIICPRPNFSSLIDI